MAFGDLSDALALAAVLLDSGTVQYQLLAADALTVQASAPHTGAHPFDNEAAFKFGDSAMARPSGPAVSMFSLKLTYSTPIRFSSSSTSRKCFTDRAIRSDAHTRTTSKRQRRASAII
jgi:hypothetical protein